MNKELAAALVLNLRNGWWTLGRSPTPEELDQIGNRGVLFAADHGPAYSQVPASTRTASGEGEPRRLEALGPEPEDFSSEEWGIWERKSEELEKRTTLAHSGEEFLNPRHGEGLLVALAEVAGITVESV